MTDQITQVTPASGWKTKAETTTLEVPSGNVCRVKHPGNMQAFITAGLVPNPLMPLVLAAVRSKQPPSMSTIEKKPELLEHFVSMMDNVICHFVVEPKVLPKPLEEDPTNDRYNPEFTRDPELLYVDEIDIDDRMFIFQWASGGTSDLEQFRREQDAAMADLRDGEDVARPTKRAARPRKR